MIYILFIFNNTILLEKVHKLMIFLNKIYIPCQCNYLSSEVNSYQFLANNYPVLGTLMN